MKQRELIFCLLYLQFILIFSACDRTPSLEISLPEKFDGQKIELINFLDSTLVASEIVKDGKVIINKPDTLPVFTSVLIDGRTRAFYILEKGKAYLNDSISSATGTPLNDELTTLMSRLDSIDSLDDKDLYVRYVREKYEENKNNPLGEYLGIELLKFSSLQEVEDIMRGSSKLGTSPKAQYFRNLALIREETSPGKKFTDFSGETETGKPVSLSSYLNDKGFTLIDFWASWCPYCIKEIPELSSLKERWGDGILKIVGVAVRDIPEDTKAIVNKHNINWPVIFNTQRVPYELYGFTGIPYHILLGANGEIISRGESVDKINEIIEKKLAQAESDINK